MLISKNPSNGFILLPIVILLLTSALILFALSHAFYTHVLLTKETQRYLNAQIMINEVIDHIEAQLSLQAQATPNPKDPSTLLNDINAWPKITINQNNAHIYSQLIHNDASYLTYESLITTGDHISQSRVIYELISTCTLAAPQCHPVQLTLL